jgi:hypothetical protein
MPPTSIKKVVIMIDGGYLRAISTKAAKEGRTLL